MRARITDGTWSRLRVSTDDAVLRDWLEHEISEGWRRNSKRRSRRIELATVGNEISYAGCRRHLAPIRTQLRRACRSLDVQITGSCGEGCDHAPFLPHPQECLQCLVASLSGGGGVRAG